MKINKKIFDNGLRLVHNEDTSTQMVALNIVYDVGARDEHPEHTGFAHLFEHLMFGGSVHIPDYDAPLQLAGGENNAWTNNDITNYYLTVPKSNVEIGFWLESDRMLELAFSEQSLEVQRAVVMEEFKQRCLNSSITTARCTSRLCSLNASSSMRSDSSQKPISTFDFGTVR